jgi:hypothetical protein
VTHEADDPFRPPPADTTASPAAPWPPSPPAQRSRRQRIVAIVAAAALLAGGTAVYLLRSSDSHQASTRPPPGSAVSKNPNLVASTRQSLDALLERRSHAIADDDREAFLADIDPANKKLVSAQQLIFDNLTKLHASENNFAISSYYTQPAPVDPNNLDGDWQRGEAHVESRVQLDEVDPRPTVAYYKWTVEVRDGKLVITGIAPSLYPEPTAPMPWETAKLTVRRTRHMLVATTPDAAKRTKQIADAAERAYRQSRSLWPSHGAADEFIIFATTNRKLMGSWYGKLESAPDPTGITIQVPTCCVRAEDRLGDVTSTHIVLDIKEARDRIDLEWLLAHELTHAVAEPKDDIDHAGTLRWADEGYAEFVGISLLDRYGFVANWDQLARNYARSKAFDDKLPADRNFYTKNAGAHYALAVRFFEYLADRYGKTTTRDFYFYLNAMKTPDPDAAMRKYFHTSEKTLVAAWATWVR